MTPSPHRSGAWLAATCAVLLTLPFSAASVRATTVTVPDDFPTIQLALDSDADTVRIRAGHYAEHPNVMSANHSRVIEGLPSNGVRPTIEGVAFSLYQEVFVYGCTFTRPVDLRAGAGLVTLTFDSCDLDSGLVHHIEDTNDYGIVAILRSTIRVGATLPATSSVCEADTFEACGVVFDNESSATVRNCWFRGPAPTVIAISYFASGGSGGHFRENTIEGFRRGIESGGLDAHMTVESNRIEHCTDGIRVANEYSDQVRNNVILDCETGIAAQVFSVLEVSGNVVLGSTQAGIDLTCDYSPPPVVTGNVVGRSGSDGIRLEQFSGSGVTLRNNTSYRNLGAGFLIRNGPGSYVLDLKNNIAFENGTYGIDADSSATPDGCNDWFGNHAGATRGVTLSGTDLALDPRFCDVDHDSVTLASNSPLIDAPGCGLIGARGLGCAATAMLLSLFTAEWVPDGVRVRWQVAPSAAFTAAWAERAGAPGGPWAAVAAEASSDGTSMVTLDRTAVADHEYWYRLAGRLHDAVAVIGAAIEVAPAAPAVSGLRSITPNPAFGDVRIEFSLARDGQIELEVLDVQGRAVAVLANGLWKAGQHGVSWSTAHVPAAGVYFVRYRFPDGSSIRRLVRIS